MAAASASTFFIPGFFAAGLRRGQALVGKLQRQTQPSRNPLGKVAGALRRAMGGSVHVNRQAGNNPRRAPLRCNPFQRQQPALAVALHNLQRTRRVSRQVSNRHAGASTTVVQSEDNHQRTEDRGQKTESGGRGMFKRFRRWWTVG